MGDPTTRQSVLDEFVNKRLHELCDDALYEAIPSSTPEWWEMRESIVRILFEMDHEFTRDGIHADYVRENCL